MPQNFDLPGSLSHTIRALALGAMSSSRVKIINPAKCDDSFAMVNCLRALGIEVIEGANFFEVLGSVENAKGAEINVGLSGRTARILLATACLIPGVRVLNCESDFKKRPMGDLVGALRSLGAEIEYLEKEGFLPLKVLSTGLRGGSVKVKGDISSQFLSALLMIAPKIGGLEIEIEGDLVSKSYVDITLQIMADFGVKVMNDNYLFFKCLPGQTCYVSEYIVPPDETANSYFQGRAFLRNREHIMKGVFDNFLRTLPGTLDLADYPDFVPTLAVVAAFTEGQTVLKGIGNLKFKESNRIESLKTELSKIGVKVEFGEDFLKIQGGKPSSVLIDPHGDHRIAMAFGMADFKVKNPEVVNKSFPNFWKMLCK